MTFSLTNRLKESLELLPKTQSLLDIGADCGFLAISFEKKCSKVYASENKKGPYNSLVSTIKKNDSSVIPLYGDGLEILPNDVETISILGMGGLTINRILTKNMDKLKNIKYILVSPQSSIHLTIKTLNDLGYKNIKGKYIFETRYYPVLLYAKGKEELTDLELFFGKVPFNNKDENLIKYIDSEINRYTNIGYKLTKRNLSMYNIFIQAREILKVDESEREK